MQQQVKKEWDNIASDDNLSDPFVNESRNFIDEIILNEMGEVEGKDILDVGCGNGDFAFKLEEKGANVLGVDISEEMYKTAKTKYPMVDFELIDFAHPEISIDKKFDFVVLELVIMFVKDVDALLQNIKKVLKEDGKVVVVLIHPLFVLSSKDFEAKAGMKFEGFDDYFVEQVLKLKSENVDFTYFSRSISWYFKKFTEKNMKVEDISEPKISGGHVNMSPQYDSLSNLPFIMLFKLSNRQRIVNL